MSTRLNRALFRGFLRWNRQPGIKNSEFILNSTEFGIDCLLPPEIRNNKIQNSEDVYTTISYCFRNQIAHPKLGKNWS
jgi:hypothetical protein